MTNPWKERARSYYDREAPTYDFTSYGDDPATYPADRIRLNHVLTIMKIAGTRKVLDVGCGTGYPLAEMLDAGIDAVGFDFAPLMVAEAKKLLSRSGHSPERVFGGDGETQSSYPRGPFDAVTALGVFPHVHDEPKLVANMSSVLLPGGLFIAQFRNALFSTYTLNQYSMQFYREAFFDSTGVLDSNPDLRRRVDDFYGKAFQIPGTVGTSANRQEGGTRTYVDLLAKFHNPLTIRELVEGAGLQWKENIFYHFHAAPPALQKTDWAVFRRLSLEMENRFARDWRGNFMASAFITVAEK